MLLFIFIREEYLTEEANFNTSHVTVYQKDWTAKVADSTISIHLMLLSIEEDHNKITGAKRISIHLMLLFIKMCTHQLCIQANFNTSHVTVYRPYRHCYNRVSEISIHLMLLFIEAIQSAMQEQYRFQYISCYCLSIKNGKQ